MSLPIITAYLLCIRLCIWRSPCQELPYIFTLYDCAFKDLPANNYRIYAPWDCAFKKSPCQKLPYICSVKIVHLKISLPRIAEFDLCINAPLKISLPNIPHICIHASIQPCGLILHNFIHRVGQNRIYTPYMTVYLVISLPKIPYTHRIYMVMASPIHTHRHDVPEPDLCAAVPSMLNATNKQTLTKRQSQISVQLSHLC